MKTLSISIIGADSYLGDYLYQSLQKQQALLGISFAFHLTSRRQPLPHHTSHENTHWHYLDLALPDTWQLPKTDVVFVFAALTGIAACEKQPKRAKQLNVDNTLQLVEQLVAQGCFCIVPSTNQVFACDEPAVAVDTHYAPCSFYGELKAQLEQKLLALKTEQVAIVRPGKVIGPNFGLFGRWIEQLTRNDVVTAFSDHRCAPVALHSLTALFIRMAVTQIGGIYQLSGEQDVSYAQLLRQIIKLFGFSADNIAECRAASQGVKPTAYGSLTPHYPDLRASVGQEYIRTYGIPSWHQGDSVANVIQHALQEEVT